LLVTPIQAHEGHQPLPTKGVQVDTDRGYITLSAQARDAIGLETAEVATGVVSSRLAAYAEVVTPWNTRAFGSAQLSGRIAKLLVRPGDSVEKDQVVAELLETAFKGRVVSRVIEEDKYFGLVVWYDEPSRRDPSTIEDTIIETPSGAKVALSQVAEVLDTTGPNVLNRENV
jgi:hypothetical protein